MSDSAPRIGIVLALKEELAALAAALASVPEEHRGAVRLLRGGIGGAAAARAAERLAAVPGLKLLCATGFSGGLQDSASPVGALVLGTAILASESVAREAPGPVTWPALPVAAERTVEAAQALRAAGVSFLEGPLVTVARPVLTPADKRALGRNSGALAVDMETAAVARVAQRHGLDFLALRTISDTVDDELPPQVAGFLDEAGAVKAKQVLQFALTSPGNVGRLWKLKGRAETAGASLQRAWTAVLPGWAAKPPSS